MKKPKSKKLDVSRLILLIGIATMLLFLIALGFIAVIGGSAAILFYALPYGIVAGYSLLVLRRLEVTSAILKRMTILASIFGTLSAIYLLVAFAATMRFF